MADGKFSPDTVALLGRRAALLCSNPDCRVLTAGPGAEHSQSVNIGEAAHIYGRTASSARHNSALSLSELADSTNGIWLCRNCHKQIDNDPTRFPAELLFEWLREHAKLVLERIGKRGDQIREKLRDENLKAFESTTALAQQIVIDRPEQWQFKLAAELLRHSLGAVHQRWLQLSKGVYVQPMTVVSREDVGQWLAAKFSDLSNAVESVPLLLTELNNSWINSHAVGADRRVLDVCNLIAALAEHLLLWEEVIRFSALPREFAQVLACLQGVAGRQLEELLKVPAELTKLFGGVSVIGAHQLMLEFKLPDDFVSNYGRAFAAACEAMQRS